MKATLELLGRFHPVVVHVPLTLILLGGFLEVMRLFRKDVLIAPATRWCFALGALGAALSAPTGWLLAQHGHHPPDERQTIEIHRWLGVAAFALAGFAWAAQRRWGQSEKGAGVWFRRTSSWVAATLTALAGHFGAVIVWGSDWFS